MKALKAMNIKPSRFITTGLFCCFFSLPLFSQDEVDLELIGKELDYQLNEYRKQNSLLQFNRSETLDAIAFDQAEYVAEKGRIIHEQEKEQKKTLLDRILFYQALNAEAGENIAMIAPNSKAIIEKGGEKVILQNEELIVKACLYSWLKDEDSKLNMVDPNFYEIGIGIHESERKEIILVAVIASAPYLVPEGVKQKFNFRGLEPYKAEKCKDYEENYSTSPELFSDAFSMNNGELFFSYHNKALIEQLLENSSDGISAEIITKDQFECKDGNRLFPGGVTNGYLMPVIRKGAIANLNLAEKESQLKLKIGEVPEAYLNKTFEVNGMIIKDNSKCASIPHNKIEVENLRWLDIPFKMSTIANDSSLSWRDSLHIEFYAKRIYSLDSEIVENSKLIKQLGFEIEDIDFDISISPTEDPEIFDGFEYELLRALGLDSSKLTENNYHKQINWQAYEDFQENTFYQLETRELNQEKKIEYLQETRKTDPKLDQFLDSLSYMKIGIYGRVNLDQEMSLEQEKKLFQFALHQKKADLALHLFNKLLENPSVDRDELLEIYSQLKQNKEELSLINNLIVKLANEGDLIFDGNPLTTAFLQLHLVDRSNPMVRYNYLVSKLKDQAFNNVKIGNTKEWESSLNKLRTVIDAKLYTRIMLNYRMLMADQFYEEGKPELREKAFKNIMTLIPKVEAEEELSLALAKYLAYQDQASSAIKILMPIVRSEKVPSEHLFYYLQLAIYDDELVPPNSYFSTMQRAADLYPKDFCKVFSKDRMGFQALSDHQIKLLYCSQCEN